MTESNEQNKALANHRFAALIQESTRLHGVMERATQTDEIMIVEIGVLSESRTDIPVPFRWSGYCGIDARSAVRHERCLTKEAFHSAPTFISIQKVIRGYGEYLHYNIIQWMESPEGVPFKEMVADVMYDKGISEVAGVKITRIKDEEQKDG